MTQRAIRRARPGDAPVLAALQDRSVQRGGDHAGVAGSRRPPGFLEQDQVFVLEEGDRITGFHVLRRAGDDLVLERLVVDPDFAGAGRGTLLWRHAVNMARHSGHGTLLVLNDPDAASFDGALGNVVTAMRESGAREQDLPVSRYGIVPWVIREARLDEAEALHALTQRSTMHWGYEPAFLDWEPEAIAVTPEFLAVATSYVLTEGEVAIGYYALVRGEDGPRLDKLFVDDGWIGTGAGKALWQHMIETARGMAGNRLEFLADPNAAPFYRAMGATWLREVQTSRPGWALQVFAYDLG